MHFLLTGVLWPSRPHKGLGQITGVFWVLSFQWMVQQPQAQLPSLSAPCQFCSQFLLWHWIFVFLGFLALQPHISICYQCFWGTTCHILDENPNTWGIPKLTLGVNILFLWKPWKVLGHIQLNIHNYHKGNTVWQQHAWGKMLIFMCKYADKLVQQFPFLDPIWMPGLH